MKNGIDRNRRIGPHIGRNPLASVREAAGALDSSDCGQIAALISSASTVGFAAQSRIRCNLVGA
jgi:hypothetical protein